MLLHNVKMQMLLNGDTNKSVAQLLGISAPTVSRKVHKKTDFTLEQLDCLANYWGVSIDYLAEI